MQKIQVRVRPGFRLYESGATRLPGQTFWIWEDRLPSLAKEVDVVKGAKPMQIQTTAVGQPAPSAEVTEMPQPVTRLAQPRQPEQPKQPKQTRRTRPA